MRDAVMNGSEVVTARKLMGKDRTEFAIILGIHYTTLMRYENGELEVPPSMAKLIRFVANAELKAPVSA